MPELNAGLIQIGDLGNQIQLGRQAARQDKQQLLGSIGSLIGTAGTVRDNMALDEALKANYDPATGQLNQQGVLSALYQYKPQMAQEMAQKYATQSMASQKLQAELGKTSAETAKLGAEAGKIGAETQGIDLKTQQDRLATMSKMILSIDPARPETFQKAIQFGRSIGAPVELFEGIDTKNPEQIKALKKQAFGMVVDAEKQVELEINQQNANTNTLNAQTQAQKANQDFAVSQDRLSVDTFNANTERSKAMNTIATTGMATPQQRFENDLKLQEARNQQETNAIAKVNEIGQKVSTIDALNANLEKAAAEAERLLSNPLISGRKDPKTGKFLPNESSYLGTAGEMIGRATSLGASDYKKFDSGLDTLRSIVTSKGMSEARVNYGAIGTQTDADARTFAGLEGINATPEEFAKKGAVEMTRTLQEIVDSSRATIERNKQTKLKFEDQKARIEAQRINTPGGKLPGMPSGGSGYASAMPSQGASLPPGAQPGQVIFTAPNGVKLTPELIAKAEAHFARQKG